MNHGIPLLRGEASALPDSTVHEALLTFCGQLACGGVGSAAERLRDVVERRLIDPCSLVAASVARDRPAFQCSAAQLDLAADLLWLVAELVAAPFAHAWQNSARSEPGTGPIQEALSRWTQGYCPCCGSWPIFSLRVGPRAASGDRPASHTDERTRTLQCSFCGAPWQRATACVFCGETGVTLFRDMHPFDGDDESGWLELCDPCRGYMKALEVAQPIPFAILAVEDLATTPLDVAAAERGFCKPALPEIEVHG